MAITASQLIGMWSVDIRYGAGAQEDELLVFRPDGSGWFAFEHYTLQELETFSWTLSDGNHLYLKGETYFSAAEATAQGIRQVTEQPSQLDITRTILSIAPEQTPSGQQLDALTLDGLLINSTQYGLVSRDAARFELPSF